MSDTQPTNATDGLFWLDTSSGGNGKVLKRYDSSTGNWVVCNVTESDLDTLSQRITSQYQAAIASLDYSKIVVSATAPANPTDGLFWLDTSTSGGNGKVLKRWDATANDWLVCNVTPAELNQLAQDIADVEDAIDALDFTQIVVSDDEPTDKKDGLLWLDTDTASNGKVLKRWDASLTPPAWVVCNVTPDDLDSLSASLSGQITSTYNTVTSEYQQAIRDLDWTQIVVSATEPTNKKEGLLWLDTSNPSVGNILKRWVASATPPAWEICGVTNDDLSNLQQAITNSYTSAINTASTNLTNAYQAAIDG